MKLAVALIISAMHAHIAYCAPQPLENYAHIWDAGPHANEELAPYEGGHRARDVTITVAQSLFEDPSIKSCVSASYGCSRSYCWKKVRFDLVIVIAAPSNSTSAPKQETGAGP